MRRIINTYFKNTMCANVRYTISTWTMNLLTNFSFQRINHNNWIQIFLFAFFWNRIDPDNRLQTYLMSIWNRKVMWFRFFVPKWERSHANCSDGTDNFHCSNDSKIFHVANALKQWVNKARSNTGGRPLEKDRRAMATLQTMLMGAESSNIKQFCSELDMTYGDFLIHKTKKILCHSISLFSS